MNEMDTVLRTRLHSLADDLTRATPAASSHADAARARFRRQRRVRAGLAVASAVVAAALVAVPVIGSQSSPAPGRGAADPGVTTSPSPSGTESGLRPLADDLRNALLARAAPLSFAGPTAGRSCADRAPTVTSALGLLPAEHSSGAAQGDCVWRTPAGDLQVAIGFMAGGTVDQIQADVDAETARDGCLSTDLPGSLTVAALALCEEDGGTGWHVRVMDTGGTGFWLVSVTVGDHRPQDQVSTVAAVLDAADADL